MMVNEMEHVRGLLVELLEGTDLVITHLAIFREPDEEGLAVARMVTGMDDGVNLFDGVEVPLETDCDDVLRIPPEFELDSPDVQGITEEQAKAWVEMR